MRPPDQTAKAVRADRKHLERILERAQENTVRSRARNEEITRHLSRLVVLYTEETIDNGGDSSQRIQDMTPPTPSVPAKRKTA